MGFHGERSGKWTLLAALKMWMLDQPEARAALMSGSGSTVFAVTHDAAAAAALAERAQAWCGATTWIRVAHTLCPQPAFAPV
jgi:4-diphosphocytidyl-2-C-methyl-D-erythritol kinase